jgi:hypothetical protein
VDTQLLVTFDPVFRICIRKDVYLYFVPLESDARNATLCGHCRKEMKKPKCVKMQGRHLLLQGLPGQDVEGRAQGRVRGRCAPHQTHARPPTAEQQRVLKRRQSVLLLPTGGAWRQ